MRIWMIAPLTLAVFAAGCGQTNTQRAATGGVGGAAIGAAAGGPVGALVGAGVGAAGGMFRDPIVQESDVAVNRVTNRAQAQLQDEGPASSTAAAQEPAPRPSAARVARADLTNDEVREAQTALKRMGLYEGEVDGLYGRRTISAVREFQTQQDIRQTGALDQQTQQKLQVAAREGGTPRSGQGQPATEGTDQPSKTPRGGSDVEQTAEEPEKPKPRQSAPTTP